MTGEVLPRRDHAVILHTPDEGPTEGGNALRILAIRPRVDHGIVGVVVDIEDGREIDMYAERASFDRGDPAFLVRQCRVVGRSKRHLGWEDCCAPEIDRVGDEIPAARSHARTVLQITGDKER